MLAVTEIQRITETQLPAQLLASIEAAVAAVVAPVPERAAEPAHWIDTSIDEFKRQAPGSVLTMMDGSLRYVPTGKNSTRGPTDTLELEVRLSSDGKDGGATWVSVASVTSTIDKVAWGVCTSNGKAGVFASGLKADGLPVELRPAHLRTSFRVCVHAD